MKVSLIQSEWSSARVCVYVCVRLHIPAEWMSERVSEQTNDRPSSSVSAVCIVSLILLLCFNICFAILLYLDNCDFSVYVILSSVVWLGWFALLWLWSQSFFLLFNICFFFGFTPQNWHIHGSIADFMAV